jgi:hypothetical protein
MAIEIESVKKGGSGKENIALVFSILVLLASFGFYFYYSQVVLSQKKVEVSNLNSELANLGQEDIASKEAELALAGKEINDFKVLFQNNPKASAFFVVFQEWVHPKVSYSGFNFDIALRKISMSGTTSGFQNVMQQIAILDQEDTIDGYQISNVALSESGAVTFDLDLIINQAVLE